MADKLKGDPGDDEARRNLTNKLTESKKRGQTQGNNRGEKVAKDRESGHCCGNIFYSYYLFYLYYERHHLTVSYIS